MRRCLAAAAGAVLGLVAGCGDRGAVQADGPSCLGAADGIGGFVTVPAGQLPAPVDVLYPEEAGRPALQVSAFRIQTHEVTNDQFAEFVAATAHVTDAEHARPGAGSAVFRMPGEARSRPDPWELVEGATWRSPEGPGSDIEGRGSYPVVHVSLNDARAYAAWAGGRLPDEAEWEHAARLNLPDPSREGSGAHGAAGDYLANTWQGIFPLHDTGADGFQGAAPVGCFAAGRLGLYDMIGNVWEWTETPFDAATYTIKGGSYLCAPNFCRRYRPAARQPQEADFSTNHIGFRIVKDIPEADDQFGQ
ncbi:SUMF1/EgtB/PvdO family nonheme iron enzyme [Hyphomonas sp.]|uniref:SUMF1/EgtB/PvdO family nonheme iron enzyme n=1 Tax=Hyphomonas sp. TaxID=87 RepID=UPI003918AA8C